MARTIQEGLLYFPLDVNFFSDKKIKILKSRFGPDGITVYLYILCEIYRDKGYYIEISDDFKYIISDDLNMSYEKIEQILKFLFDRSLLAAIAIEGTSKLITSDTIITARSIQKQYQACKKGAKRDVEVFEEIWILEKENTASFIKPVLKLINPGNMAINPGKKAINLGNIHKEKKSKEKNNKRILYGEFRNVCLSAYEVKKINERWPGMFERIIEKLGSYKASTGKEYKSDYAAVCQWVGKSVTEDNTNTKMHAKKTTAAGTVISQDRVDAVKKLEADALERTNKELEAFMNAKGGELDCDTE